MKYMEVTSPEVIWADTWRRRKSAARAFDHYYAGVSLAVAISVTGSYRFSRAGWTCDN